MDLDRASFAAGHTATPAEPVRLANFRPITSAPRVMTNDEIRMTKEGRMTNFERRNLWFQGCDKAFSSFVIRHFFVISHSSLGI